MFNNPNQIDRRQPRRMAAQSRRRFLRGLGITMALPAFDSLLPRSVTFAGDAAAPTRMAFVYFPNGAIPAKWTPIGLGSDFQFNDSTKPLEPFRQQLQFIRGLQNKSSDAGSDGGGAHARANSTFLTGQRIKKTAGAKVRAAVSIDQVAAGRIGHLTRFPSLELTCDTVRQSGECDTGYSCIYQHNFSWRSNTSPMPPEANPRLVFERLFGSGTKSERTANYRQRQQQKRPILDFVMQDVGDINQQLSAADRRKLDEYLTSVREIESRIQHLDNFTDVPNPDVAAPLGIPENHTEYVRLMYDMLLLAFQTDSTRIATLMLGGDGDNRPYTHIGIAEGHHYLTHHAGDEDKIAKVTQIDHWYSQQFAYFLDRMQNTIESNGRSLLDNSMILFGSGLNDGNRHTNEDLPIVLAGSGGGSLNPGVVRDVDEKPLTNLFLSMTDRMGLTDLSEFGDSTGRIKNI